MSYRIYLRTTDGNIFERTETGARSIAETVFDTFLGREELEGEAISVHLEYLRSALATHRFDSAPGTPDNWQGKLREIPWPASQGQVGRPAELEGGARHNVYLDAVSIARAKKLGKGNLSEGIRIALSWIS
ncbi:hypothetical protein [Noviherbaspirillum pedocola]|uniref:Uncharacterized protein n=1 Tax=Noviherbaspirillum pedocola TaxID=2801341 RepID=A0A934SY11_9BURK|nr:hypothetical protein [Noviherbaspirillum pedocola]MBK4737827.1 hypothetical protein [Noviherbaspirillum pedocola]